MRRPSAPNLLSLAVVVMLAAVACGKRADPLAPYVKTPQPPASLEVAQIGDVMEVRVVAPRTTTENRPLPVIELEWLEAPFTGPIGKDAKVLEREEVAPGELRVKRMPIPAAPLRITVRASSGKAVSALAAPVAFAPMPVPSPPTGLQATVRPDGVLLTWTNPPGAEPWPTPSPSPSPSPSPTASESPSPSTEKPAEADAEPAAKPSPAPESPAPVVAPVPAVPLPGQEAPPPAAAGKPDAPPGTPPAAPGAPPAVAPPGASPLPAPAPTPPPLPPTGIRIFRTDGAPRPAHEPLQANTWLDTSVKPGDTPCYAISYATAFKPLVVSVQTEPVCVEIKDVTPPTAPTRLAADLGSTFIEVSWLASDSPDVASYRLYRTIGAGVREVALQTEGLVTRVQDPTMTPGPRTYEVVAVDAAGNESAATPPVRIVIP
jgi:hypothetical protein